MDDAPIVLGEDDVSNIVSSMTETEKENEFELAEVQPYLVSLEDAMMNFDTVVNVTQDMRHKLLKKMARALNDMEMETSFASDPDVFQAQSRFISEFRGLLNDIDTSSKNQINVKLKKSDIEAQHQSNFNAAEVLAYFRLQDRKPVEQVTANNLALPDEATIEQNIQQRFEQENLKIPETELELGGSNLPKHNQSEEDM